jgi:serine protease Do
MKARLLRSVLLLFLAISPGALFAQAPPTDHAPALAAPQGKVPPPLGSIDIGNEPIVRVVANVQPAVVNVTAQATVPEYYNTIYDSFFSRYYGTRNRPEQSIGSGLLISADGYILTNAHVVALADQEKTVSITLTSGSKYRARIVSADDDADLALLKIEDKAVQFPYFDLAYTSPNLLGETVIALGSPAGYQNSVSHGILSAKNRSFSVRDESGGNHTYANLIQTDAAINPGNSGGPLVDINGGLVGINSAKLAGEAIENIGFAIPNEIVVPWAHDAIAVARGLKPAAVARTETLLDSVRQHLGFGLKNLPADKAAEMNLEAGSGMIITDVQDQSPAAEAGLQEDMIVTGINRSPVTDEKTLPPELGHLQPGTNVRVHVIYFQSAAGPILFQRGGSVILVSR